MNVTSAFHILYESVQYFNQKASFYEYLVYSARQSVTFMSVATLSIIGNWDTVYTRIPLSWCS